MVGSLQNIFITWSVLNILMIFGIKEKNIYFVTYDCGPGSHMKMKKDFIDIEK